MSDKYGVVGNPIAHSLSPKIHTEFAKLTQQDLVYDKYCLDLDNFENEIRHFQQQGFKGLNVTVPFKERAYAICDAVSTRAELAKAVNTLLFNQDRTILGDNTDGIGLIRDITIKHQFSLTDKTILLLGAGGAARGVIKPLLDEQPHSLTIANRTFLKAEELAAEFKQKLKAPITVKAFSKLNHSFDCITNATAMGLTENELNLPITLIQTHTCCYDMVYGKPTAFLKWAKQGHAALVLDGLGMLIEQAAEAFFLWRGVRPPTDLSIV